MSTDRKSIAQIKKEFAEAKEGSLEELFAQYAMDERSGVKAVLNSYRKKQEKLAKERVRLEEMRSYEHQYISRSWKIPNGSGHRWPRYFAAGTRLWHTANWPN